jgi:hypothetical protein
MILARYFIYTRINRISHITAASPGHPADHSTFWHRDNIFSPYYIDNALYKSICELYFIILYADRRRITRFFHLILSLKCLKSIVSLLYLLIIIFMF